MKIVVTEPARNSLYEIYHYYKIVVNKDIASKILTGIKDSIKILLTNPEIGQTEILLENLNLGHRRIICGNYKIIYRIYKEIIYITDIFDTRREPAKINQ